MLKNYLKITWRSLWKNKQFSLINILGLSIAFSISILLAMDGFHKLSYDQFHENGSRRFQTYITWQTPEGTEVGASQPTPFAPTLKAQVPGVAKVTRHLEEEALTFYEQQEIGLDALYVDADFFTMFSFPITQGVKDNPLRDPNAVVVSATAAEKLFGEENPIGKTVNILINGNKEPFIVKAVSVNRPNNSTLGFDIAIPFEKNPEYATTKERWGAQYHEVFVELEPGVAQNTFEENSRSFTNLNYKRSIESLKNYGAVPNEHGNFLQLGLIPIADINFVAVKEGKVTINKNSIYILFGVAFLILFIACVNYVNMNIAKTAQRLKEIGMRKTLGAKKGQLFFQFWSESLVVFLLSIGIGLILSLLLEHNFQTIFRTKATLAVLLSTETLVAALLFVFAVTIVVGGYPALLISRLTTIQSLKGKLESTGKNRLRDALVVLQFSIAILMISGTLILRGQLDFMRNKDLGYDKEQVYSFPLTGKKNSYDAVKLLRQELANEPGILGITASDNTLGRGKDGSQYTSVWGFDYKGKGIKTNTLVIDYDYTKTLGLELVKGRDFDSARKADEHAILINESMAKALGENDPLTARIPMNDTLNYSVIGVVKDYNFQDISKAIEPLTFFLDREQGLVYAYLKVAPQHMAQAVTAIEEAYKRVEPKAAFLGSILDENVDRTFNREKNLASLITSGSIVAFVLICIGLFAMAMLITTQRIKEIGIRKVIGASVASITFLLTKDFLKLVLVAFAIATPIAWWFANGWLEGYANRMDLNWHFFTISGMIAMCIAILTIGTRTIKSALANPVNSLRSE